jgi:DNA repair exonuclease SbcCD ATPase subunit
MYLKLTNVRQHKNFEITLPNFGTVLVSGPSGAGKTSILDAIEDCLLGTGSEMQSWSGGTGEMLLKLEYPKPATIYRKRNPHYLEVECEGTKYVDEAAQGFILSHILNMTPEEFDACAYIRQEGAGSLLTLSPADQMRFIQRLSSAKLNPEDFKKEIQLYTKSRAQQVESLVREQSSSNQTMAELNRTLESNAAEEPKRTVLPEAVLEAKKQLAESQERATVQSNLQQRLMAELKDSKHDFMANFEAGLSALNQKKTDIEAKLKTLVLPEMPVDNSISETLIANTRMYLKIKEDMVDLANSFYEKYPDSKGKLLEYIEKYKQEISEQNSATAERVAHLSHKRNELLKSPAPQSCPYCNKQLIVVDSKIIAPDSDLSKNAELAAAIAQDIEAARSQLSGNSGLLMELDKTFNTAAALKNQLKSIDQSKILKAVAPDMHALDNLIDQNNKLKAEFKAAMAQYNNLSGEINANKNMLNDLNNQINALHQKKQSIVIEKTKEQLHAELEELQKKSKETLDAIASAQSVIAEDERYNLMHNAYLSKLKLINDVSSQKDSLITKQKDMQEHIDLLHAEIAAASRLKELSDFAATASLEAVVDKINTASGQYIERMFDEDGTTVEIKNFSTTAKGEDKAKISIDITHKGKKVKRLSSLSGGEKARLRLAFQLGLSSLFNAPFLLIDEGFAGLDEENRNKCMELLKDISKDRLVLMVEHGANEGWFDEVVYL